MSTDLDRIPALHGDQEFQVATAIQGDPGGLQKSGEAGLRQRRPRHARHQDARPPGTGRGRLDDDPGGDDGDSVLGDAKVVDQNLAEFVAWDDECVQPSAADA
nr:hypothetical protein [Paludisphaera rhizosphaerae]